MGLFDMFKSMAGNAVKAEAAKAVVGAVNSIGKGKNRSEKFTFSEIPKNLNELKSLPEAKLDSPFKTTALTMLVLCNFGENQEETFAMLDFLKGPENVSTYEKGFIKERLDGKTYKPFSYFDGATPENGYTPSKPYSIEVSENPYSFDNENWAVLWVKSGGGDNPRQIKLRKKPSTGQWFLNEIQCLSDIRVPVSEDPWA